MSGRFAEQIVVVTGGASGIGEAFAARAAREGAHTVSWDLTQTAPACEWGLSVDVTDAAAVSGAMEATLERYGRVDVMVTSAGITGPVAPVADYDPDLWAKVLSINLTGTFLCLRAAVAPMVRQGYGRMVAISSIAGKEGNPYQAAYSASKAGVIALVKSLGKELAETGVRVNAVTPAITATALVNQMTAAQRALVLEKIPMKRVGEPDEIAALIAFLASHDCTFSTAAVFDASGGRATY